MNIRLLLNAEPFGFGPTAAVAAFVPHLRPACRRLAYAGVGHTLDLQRQLPHDSIHDLTGEPPEAWRSVLRDYDTFLTALDYDAASLAVDEGLKVAFYDPLVWYHPKIPDVAKRCFYLVQDFFGVEERLKSDEHLFGNVTIVPPIIGNPPADRHPEITLANLGGIQNPFWPVELSTAYAKAVINSIRAAVPARQALEFAVSEAVARQLSMPDVRCRTPQEMKSLMSRSAIAFMTPGLGNLYDAADHRLPTVWLPPANDSQGRQLQILRRKEFTCVGVDWADLGLSVDYKQQQRIVLDEIASNIRWLGMPDGQRQFSAVLEALSAQLFASSDHDADRLVQHFGRGGAQTVAAAVLRWFQSE